MLGICFFFYLKKIQNPILESNGSNVNRKNQKMHFSSVEFVFVEIFIHRPEKKKPILRFITETYFTFYNTYKPSLNYVMKKKTDKIQLLDCYLVGAIFINIL